MTALWHFNRSALSSSDSGLQAWARAERASALLEALLNDPASPVIEAVLKEMSALGIELEPSEVVLLLRAGGTHQVEPVVPRPIAAASQAGAAPQPAVQAPGSLTTKRNFSVFPVGKDGALGPRDVLRLWLSRGRWGLRASTPHRARVAPGDWCCFYLPKVGVAAFAVISAAADQKVSSTDWPGPGAYANDVFDVPLEKIEWLPTPVVLDASLRATLDAFAGKDPGKPWAWMVMSTNQVSAHDFELMTHGLPS